MQFQHLATQPGGGTDLEMGYGDVWPWRPPSPVVRKDPISSKSVSSQDPLFRKFGNCSLYSHIFAQSLAFKPPNLEIFSSQAPKFGKFQFTSPLFQRQISVRKPPLRKSGPHTPTWKKKNWVPHWATQASRKSILLSPRYWYTSIGQYYTIFAFRYCEFLDNTSTF